MRISHTSEELNVELTGKPPPCWQGFRDPEGSVVAAKEEEQSVGDQPTNAEPCMLQYEPAQEDMPSGQQ